MINTVITFSNLIDQIWFTLSNTVKLTLKFMLNIYFTFISVLCYYLKLTLNEGIFKKSSNSDIFIIMQINNKY